MTIAIIIAFIVTVYAGISTLALGGKSDENYRQAYKANTIRLIAIYAVVIIASFAALGWYISNL